MKLAISTVLAAVALAGCATHGSQSGRTNGYPAQGLFINGNLDSLVKEFEQLCPSFDDSHVEVSNTSRVVCSRTLTGWEASVAHFKIGNKYSKTPKRKVHFYMTKRDNGVYVKIYDTTETDTKYGQHRELQMNSRSDVRKMENLLTSMGAVLAEDEE